MTAAQQQEMRRIYDDARTAGLSPAMAVQAMRDYAYARGWTVPSAFVTELRRR